MTATPTTKDRIVHQAAELFGRQGYYGTGIKQIVDAAEAQLASLYHYFPGGKEHLGAEVIRSSGELYRQLIVAIFDPAPDPATGIASFFDGAAQHLVETDYADACPIATVALEVASTNDSLRDATAAVFDSWIDTTAKYMQRAGLTRAKATELASFALSALEGAFILGQTQRSPVPVQVAGRHVAAVVRAELECRPSRKRPSSKKAPPRSTTREPRRRRDA